MGMQEHISLIHNYVIADKKIVENFTSMDTSETEEGSFRWIHMDLNSPETIRWIEKDAGLDEIVAEQLLAEETRPRATFYDEGILINFRGVNLNENSDPEDMISIRMFITEDTIYSLVYRKLKAVEDIKRYLKRKDGPESVGEFVAMLIDFLTDRAEDVISRLRERSIDVENALLDGNEHVDRSEVTNIRRVAVHFMRYFVPQKDAVSRILVSKTDYFSQDDKDYIVATQNRLKRFTEEIEHINNRCQLLYDELSSYMAEKLNRNLYVLSIVTAIFLPLGFLTGLFGINLGGMPGAENKLGFTVFTVLLLCILVLQIIILKKNKWL